MAEVTAVMVKGPRERAGSGMMEHKKALTVTSGNIKKAINNMRAVDAIKAAKKAGNIAAEGSIAVEIAVNNKIAMIIRVSSQTDFLALQGDFKGFAAESLEKTFSEKLADAAPLVEAREGARLALVVRTGENVNAHHLTRVEGDVVDVYLHGHRIGIVVNLKGGNPELVKDIAIHVAASSLQSLSTSEVSEEAIVKEKEIFLVPNTNKIVNKSENIVGNMVKGRISKFLVEVSLAEQPFVKNPEVRVDDLARQTGVEIVSFVRYEVDEGIERAEVNFAVKVTAQVAATKQ